MRGRGTNPARRFGLGPSPTDLPLALPAEHCVGRRLDLA